MVKFIKVPKKIYAEIFQSVEIKFSFVKKVNEETYQQLFSGVVCRDFLGDCIWSKKSKQKAGIYSFYYDYKSTPYDSDKLRLSLTFPDQEAMENFKNNFDDLRNKDMLAKVNSQSQWVQTDDPMTLIVEADPVWQSNTWKLSLFTFFMKCISYKTMNDLQKPENTYITYLTPNIERKLLQQVHKEDDVIPDTINQAHNYSGFVSIIRNQNKEMNAILLGA